MIKKLYNHLIYQCFQKSYSLKRKFVLPYEQLLRLKILFGRNNFDLKIKANVEALKIRFYFIEKNFSVSENFIEKIYYSKKGYFNIKEKFKIKVKNFFIYNQVSSNIFNLKLKITFKKFFFNIAFFNKDKHFKSQKINFKNV